jgi:hypothetical protein
MAQQIGTAGRSSTNSPAAFLAGSLLAVATMGTVLILALALGVSVALPDAAARDAAPGRVVVQATGGGIEYTGIPYTPAHAGPLDPSSISVPDRLDPIELDYIRHAQVGHGGVSSSVSVPPTTVAPSRQQEIRRNHLAAR